MIGGPRNGDRNNIMRDIDDAYRHGGPEAVRDFVTSNREQTHKAPPRRHPMQNDENRYCGVCVGGPRAGARVTLNSPEYTVATPYSLDYIARSDGDYGSARHSTSGYDYVALTTQIGVWLHDSVRESGVSLADAAISRLLDGYGTDPVAQGDDDA
tara:strand:+ start:17881 stop:18345 length:465 start_codon:yes stop_codon:yes gene_type:complete